MRRLILNRFTARAVDHLALSLCWLVGSLPLVTAPAATASLFEVARQRGHDPEAGRAESFVAAFRQHLRPSLLVGLGWAAVGGLLAVDLLIVARMGQPAGGVLLVALLALLLLYALGSVALFPVLVSYQARPLQLARTALTVALLFPGRSLLALAAVAAAIAAVWFVPLAVLVTPSLAATAVWRLYQGAFDRLRASAGAARPAPAVTTPVPLTH